MTSVPGNDSSFRGNRGKSVEGDGSLLPSPSNPLLALLGPDSLPFRLMRRLSRPIEVPGMIDPIKTLADEIRARQAAREAALSPEEREALQRVRDGVFREAFETGPAPAGGLQEFSDDVPASE